MCPNSFDVIAISGSALKLTGISSGDKYTLGTDTGIKTATVYFDVAENGVPSRSDIFGKALATQISFTVDNRTHGDAF